MLDNITKLYYYLIMKEWISEEVKQLRESYKLTRRALGELVGVSVTTVYQWEKGVRRPRRTTKILLSRVEKELMGKLPTG